MSTIFVIRKNIYVPESGCWEELISERQLISKTPTGYRLAANSSGFPKGLLFSNRDHFMFDNRPAALEHLAKELNRLADEFNQKKINAVRLMCDVHDTIRREEEGLNHAG